MFKTLFAYVLVLFLLYSGAKEREPQHKRMRKDYKTETDRCFLEPHRVRKKLRIGTVREIKLERELEEMSGEEKSNFNSLWCIQDLSVFYPHEKTRSECLVPARATLAFHTDRGKQTSH